MITAGAFEPDPPPPNLPVWSVFIINGVFFPAMLFACTVSDWAMCLGGTPCSESSFL